MKITAPERWLESVDVEALRQWFIGRGFEVQGRWLVMVGTCTQILLPQNLKEFRDWKLRLIEAVEKAATLEGITSAEWFEQQRVGKRSG